MILIFAWIMLYLVGVVCAWYVIAWANDREEHEWNKMRFFMVYFSWLTILAILLAELLAYIASRASRMPKPTLKKK